MARADHARRHHYLAQMYLKGFAEGRHIWCARRRDGLRVFAANPEKVAARVDYYTLPDGWGDPLAVEQWFSSVEDLAAPYLRRVAPDAPPTLDEYRAILGFVAITHARVPGQRERQERMYLDIVEASACAAASRTLPTEGYTIEGNTGIGLVLNEVDAMFGLLIDFHPMFVFTERPAFLTSDRPVLLEYEVDEARSRAKRERMGPTYNEASDLLRPHRLRRVAMPLTSTCAVVLDAVPGNPPATVVPANGAVVRGLNRAVVRDAVEVFGWSRHVVETAFSAD